MTREATGSPLNQTPRTNKARVSDRVEHRRRLRMTQPPVIETRTRIELPTSTIATVLFTAALLWLLYLVRDTLFQIFLGLLLAMVLERPVQWLNARGLRRSLAIVLVLGSVVAVFAAVIALIGPRLADDVREFWDQLPRYVEAGLAWLNDVQPEVYERLEAWAVEQQQGTGSGLLDVRGLFN